MGVVLLQASFVSYATYQQSQVDHRSTLAAQQRQEMLAELQTSQADLACFADSSSRYDAALAQVILLGLGDEALPPDLTEALRTLENEAKLLENSKHLCFADVTTTTTTTPGG